MNILNGLLPYESVMLILGVALFVVLLALLVRATLKGASIGINARLFLVPILMIGFPSVQKIKFDSWEVDMTQTVAKAQSAPGDPVLQKHFEDLSKQLDIRRVLDPSLVKSIAATHVAIAATEIQSGQSDKALSNVTSALALQPSLESGLRLQSAIMVDRLSHSPVAK